MKLFELHSENHRFAGTGGVSAGNRSQRFLPAFKDTESKRVELSRFKDGTQAPMHTLDGLPEQWIVERDSEGRVVSVLETVVDGFVRDGTFFTREQAAQQLARARPAHCSPVRKIGTRIAELSRAERPKKGERVANVARS